MNNDDVTLTLDDRDRFVVVEAYQQTNAEVISTADEQHIIN